MSQGNEPNPNNTPDNTPNSSLDSSLKNSLDNSLNNTGLSKPKKILLIIAIVVFIAIALLSSFGVRWMAEQKAQSPDQVLTSCLQYESRSVNKTYINFSIEGIETTSRSGFLKQFSIDNQPLSTSVTEFMTYVRTHPEICHPVEYVKIDWAFINKVYVVSYLGDESKMNIRTAS